jgi:hypothetical protein
VIHVNNNGNDRKQKWNYNGKASSDDFDQGSVFRVIDAK